MSAHTDKLWADVKEAQAKEDAAWSAYIEACRARLKASAAAFEASDIEQYDAPLPRVTLAQAAEEVAAEQIAVTRVRRQS